jgi:heat shock protein HtpX
MSITDYHGTVADWRGQLRLNERKTKRVIVLFFLIYIALGLFADTFIAGFSWLRFILHVFC